MKAWYIALAAAVAFLIGVAIGWNQGPERVTTTERIVTREDTQARQQVAELTKQLETMKLRIRREFVVISRPDGTREEKTTEDTQVDTTTDKATTVDTKTEVSTVQTVDVVKTVEVTRSSPQWFAGPLVVFVPYAPAGQQFSAGVTIGRHIGGPFALGVSATVPVHQPVSLPTLGLSLTVSF